MITAEIKYYQEPEKPKATTYQAREVTQKELDDCIVTFKNSKYELGQTYKNSWGGHVTLVSLATNPENASYKTYSNDIEFINCSVNNNNYTFKSQYGMKSLEQFVEL